MVAVETITIGTASYSVYGTQAEVKDYLAGRLGTSAYDDASSTDRKKAHVQATRWIDRQRWSGEKASSGQATAFPRSNLYDCDGTLVDDSTVPTLVFDATCELILVLLDDATAPDTGPSNVKAVGAGSARVEFFQRESGLQPLPIQVHELVGCFLEGSASSLMGGFRSGAGVESTFDSWPDDYDLNSGGY